MAVKRTGALWALLYSALPMVVTWLSESAEAGLINGVLAAGAITITQTIMRLVDIYRSERPPKVVGSIQPHYSPPPQIQRGLLFRILIGG